MSSTGKTPGQFFLTGLQDRIDFTWLKRCQSPDDESCGLAVFIRPEAKVGMLMVFQRSALTVFSAEQFEFVSPLFVLIVVLLPEVAEEPNRSLRDDVRCVLEDSSPKSLGDADPLREWWVDSATDRELNQLHGFELFDLRNRTGSCGGDLGKSCVVPLSSWWNLSASQSGIVGGCQQQTDV